MGVGPAPSCNDGICTIDATPTNLVLVIVIPEESIALTGGQAYITTFENDSAASWSCPPTNCAPPVCTLPQPTQNNDGYFVDGATAMTVNWPLGNDTGFPTVVPAYATYRQVYGSSQQDAALLGLPVDPVTSLPNPTIGGGHVGPNGGTAIEFRASLEPGCYARTVQPYAPYSSAFPPEIIKPWSGANDDPTSVDLNLTPEQETEQNMAPQVPTFNIARADGLDGWTAYLRDITSKQVFSNVAALNGSVASNVVLATSHVPLMEDALTNLELVIEPPPGTPMPTAVFPPAGPAGSQLLPEQETYPALPTPVTMTGRVMNPAGKPIEADLIFTAIDITNVAGAPYPSNFEFVTRASARVDSQTGAAFYSVLLPRGDYEIAARPLDTASAVTVVTRSVGGPADTMTGEDIFVGALRSLEGSAVIADGRPLAGATVEVVPAQCPTSLQSPADSGPSASCMPRSAQTTSAVDGSFALEVDPGGYWLRVRPADGSRLPWVVRPVTVGLGSLTVPTVEIPAPASVGMTLKLGNETNVIADAIVRVFTDPSNGPPVEVGRAFTDGSGNYEMYLAPPSELPSPASDMLKASSRRSLLGLLHR
jgi:hypothetical protein